MEPCVPYAWQFKGEKVGIKSTQGGAWNCFGLIARDNRCHAYLTQGSVTADWISEKLDALSLCLTKLTVIVLDNASVHKKAARERRVVWEERGLFIWFLPTYSPHLNLAEILWRKLKYEWLVASDYEDAETLHYAVWQALAAVGNALFINFSEATIVEDNLT